MPDVADARAQRRAAPERARRPSGPRPRSAATSVDRMPEQRALAGAVRAQHGGDVPGLERRAHVGERPPAAVDLADLRQPQRRAPSPLMPRAARPAPPGRGRPARAARPAACAARPARAAAAARALALQRDQLGEGRLAPVDQPVALARLVAALRALAAGLAALGRRPKTIAPPTSSSASTPATLRPVASVEGRPSSVNDRTPPGAIASPGMTQYLRPPSSRSWRAPIPGPLTVSPGICSVIKREGPDPVRHRLGELARVAVVGEHEAEHHFVAGVLGGGPHQSSAWARTRRARPCRGSGAPRSCGRSPAPRRPRTPGAAGSRRAPGPGSNILSDVFSSGSISRNCRVSSCIWMMTRPPSPIVITDGSAVRSSARISARAPPRLGHRERRRAEAHPVPVQDRGVAGPVAARQVGEARDARRVALAVADVDLVRLVDHPQQHRVVGDRRAVLVEEAHLERARPAGCCR